MSVLGPHTAPPRRRKPTALSTIHPGAIASVVTQSHPSPSTVARAAGLSSPAALPTSTLVRIAPGPTTTQVVNQLVKLVPNLSMPQAVFAANLSRYTGLSPRVTAAWTLAEGGSGDGSNNWLNVGVTDSGRLGLTSDPRWSTPEGAAKLTADFIKGKWGGASTGIQAIQGAGALSEPDQLRTIAGSGWATNPNYGSLLASTAAQAVAVTNKVPRGGPTPTPPSGPKPRVLNRLTTGDADVADLNPILQRRIVQLARASGDPISVNSGFRTYQEQAQLYADRASNPNPVAVPGSSRHESGLAFDANLTPEQQSLMSRFGIGQPVANDPVHYELVGKPAQRALRFAPSGATASVGGGIASQVAAATGATPAVAQAATAAAKSQGQGGGLVSLTPPNASTVPYPSALAALFGGGQAPLGGAPQGMSTQELATMLASLASRTAASPLARMRGRRPYPLGR